MVYPDITRKKGSGGERKEGKHTHTHTHTHTKRTGLESKLS